MYFLNRFSTPAVVPKSRQNPGSNKIWAKCPKYLSLYTMDKTFLKDSFISGILTKKRCIFNTRSAMKINQT